MKKLEKKKIYLSVICCILFICTVAFLILGMPGRIAHAEDASIFTFAKINDTECSVKLKDKTITKAIVPEKVRIDNEEYTVTTITALYNINKDKIAYIKRTIIQFSNTIFYKY